MTRTRILVAALLLALVSLGCAKAIAEPERPPHRERPTADASARLPLAAVGGEHPAAQVEYMQGVNDAAWYAGVVEAERAAAVARRAGSPTVRSGGGYSADCAALSAELGLPESILWRESRCSWDAYNATGCGGRGCLGPAQVDAGHFAGTSPWNSSVGGVCADLDPSDPAQYAECVSRLPASAWG